VHTVFTTARGQGDYEAKHDRSARARSAPRICPHGDDEPCSRPLCRVHRIVARIGLSRVDFLLKPSGRRPVWRINTVPGLSEHGNLATMPRAASLGYDTSYSSS